MEAAAIHERLSARFGENVTAFEAAAKQPWAVVAAAAIAEVAAFCKADPALAFDNLLCLSAVDYPKENPPRMDVVYHLFSYKHRHYIVLKVNAPRDNPVVPTVENVWKAANWLEREIYDLLGIVFTGHPDLRRLLMPEDWPGHPLRKDFVEPAEYHGISTSRESLLKA